MQGWIYREVLEVLKLAEATGLATSKHGQGWFEQRERLIVEWNHL